MSGPALPPDPDPAPPEATPWFFSQKWATFSTIAAGLISIVALLISTAAYIAPPSPSRSSSLRVTTISIDRVKDVDFANLFGDDVGGELEEGEQSRRPDTTIVTTLENQGELAALIVSVEANITRAEQLLECEGIGGGLVVTGSYDLRIPRDVAIPSTHVVSTAFQVEPNVFDQLELTVGPYFLGEVEYPIVYEMSLAFVLSNGQRVDSEKILLVSPAIDAGVMTQIGRDLLADGSLVQCVAANRAIIDRESNDVALVSPDMLALRADYPRP